MSSLIAQAPAAADADIAVTTMQFFKKANQNPPQVCVLPFPGSGVLDGEPFSLIATGYLESVNGMDATFQLMQGTQGENFANVLGQSGACNCPAGERVPWSMRADLLYIEETGTITGTVSSDVVGVYSGPVALLTPINDIPTGTDPITQFAIAVTVTATTPAAQEPQTEPEQGQPKEGEPPYIPPPPMAGSPVPLPPVSQELCRLLLFGLAA
jgi:hypothetical protein